ncbi:hypothetical protein [Yaniella halotolerans]|uniref:hypothetical protein n=1 Tax=Yaniella halotolerans TaxID=225453 RepID=UPI0003B40815|nr:hypothetical protein [Yaniella halotolerans]
MTQQNSEEPFETDRHKHGYFERDVDDFHREANVLAGHDPQSVSADPPENLRFRRLVVFATLTIMGLCAAAIALGLMALPECENPQYNWMPCIPNL